MSHHTFTTDLLIGENTVDVEVTVSVLPYEPATRDCPGEAGGPEEVISVVADGIEITALIGVETANELLDDAVDSLRSAIAEARMCAAEDRYDAMREARGG